jgi:fatty acid desaturase
MNESLYVTAPGLENHCQARHKPLETGMERMERKTEKLDARQWWIMTITVATLLAALANLFVISNQRAAEPAAIQPYATMDKE